MSPYTLKTLDFGPLVLTRIIEQIDPERFDERTDPDRFTIREAIAHLADWEPIFQERFNRVIAKPGMTITVYDEGQLAIDRDYAGQDVWESLRRFAKDRARTAALVRSMTPEQFRIPFEHPEQGALHLEDLANMLIGHDLYHIEHATAFL